MQCMLPVKSQVWTGAISLALSGLFNQVNWREWREVLCFFIPQI